MLLFLFPMFRVHAKSVLPRFSLLLTPSRAHWIRHIRFYTDPSTVSTTTASAS
jgi:hypothetical protein